MRVRLNWGCGQCIASGWINVDRRSLPGVQLRCDLCGGLSLSTHSVDYSVGMHVVQDLPYCDILPALAEVYRVLKPGGVLRLGLPDLDKSIQAYLHRNASYFYIPDADAKRLGSKFISQIIWYGSVRTPMTVDFISEWLSRAGFVDVVSCAYQQTHSVYPDIIELDNRERESFFVEASKREG